MTLRKIQNILVGAMGYDVRSGLEVQSVAPRNQTKKVLSPQHHTLAS